MTARLQLGPERLHRRVMTLPRRLRRLQLAACARLASRSLSWRASGKIAESVRVTGRVPTQLLQASLTEWLDVSLHPASIAPKLLAATRV